MIDQQVITCLSAVFLIVAVAASYLRHRRHANNRLDSVNDEPSVKQTLQEMRAYFNLSSPKKSDLSHAFDLAPLEILSNVSQSTKTQRMKSQRTKRKGR